ncbi:uncharacterized protein LOC110033551 [Phalaenopsis equestris]|uniref:uncharacterized protein LOC110033551 n=1 Tax=Phalaenopsis equestris TaxID=78828 RepID=UPI0009E514FC|nr:uncharacterized protein LOC110033551 [Phalaenopsis equestris]
MVVDDDQRWSTVIGESRRRSTVVDRGHWGPTTVNNGGASLQLLLKALSSSSSLKLLSPLMKKWGSNEPNTSCSRRTSLFDSSIYTSIHLCSSNFLLFNKSAGSKPSKTTSDIYSTLPNPFPPSPHDKTHEPDDSVDILEEDESSPPKANLVESNLSNQADTDDEIADVDASDGEGNKGPNAAEALRAQVNAAEEGQQREESSSSSGSSESSGSGSGSGSSSDDSDDSDGDSATSAGEIDI